MSLRSISLVSLLFTLAACSSAGPHDSGSTTSNAAGTGGGMGAGNGAGGNEMIPIVTAGAGGVGGARDCSGHLDVVYRDFDTTRPNFEMPFAGDVVRRTLIKPELGSDSKPQFLDSIGCPPLKDTPLACDTSWTVSQPVIKSQATFDQWYRDVPGVNIRVSKAASARRICPRIGQFGFKSNEFFPLAATDGFGSLPRTGRTRIFSSRPRSMSASNTLRARSLHSGRRRSLDLRQRQAGARPRQHPRRSRGGHRFRRAGSIARADGSIELPDGHLSRRAPHVSLEFSDRDQYPLLHSRRHPGLRAYSIGARSRPEADRRRGARSRRPTTV